MDLKLKDKVYIVSGGSEGIGAAITRTLVEEGAKVLILTKAVEATHQMENTLNEKELRVVAEIGTLPDVALCQKAVESALNNFGRLDGVVNNAGVNDSAGLEAGPEAFRSSVELNLFHFYDLVYCALPQLKQNRGSIINIASKVALTGQGGTSGYAAAKGAILGLTREWAVELLPFAIRVNAILPAEVMTPLYRKWLKQFEHPEKMEMQIRSKIPLENRMTRPAEIAALVAFLLSDKSGHTTGQFLHPDGGYVHLDRKLT